MCSSLFISKNEIRLQFTVAMSAMYRDEVPQYDHLCSLVKTVNARALQNNPEALFKEQIKLLEVERHGAIRLGTAKELSSIRRLFGVMGMQAVDYYDLSMAGIPVHSTAFRAISPEELQVSPFRVFTSLLRLDLITDDRLRQQAEKILSKRHIFSKELINLIGKSESQGGLTVEQAAQFVEEALEVFRWHQQASVNKKSYGELNVTHRLIADVVSFKGLHINHLTVSTLDIDEVQLQFSKQVIKAKSVVEGPPKRECPILLRQTSFIAVEEAVIYSDGQQGTHTARFGEVEQRGIALTPKGRLLYDQLLSSARSNHENSETDYNRCLDKAFSKFPDSYHLLREQGLAYFHYSANQNTIDINKDSISLERLIESGSIMFTPIVYEDFLPVSAAGIFNSNLQNENNAEPIQKMEQNPNQASFEEALGVDLLDSFCLYENSQQKSLEGALEALGVTNFINCK